MSKNCGAKTRSGGKCKKPGTGAGGRCRQHGGASPVGPASLGWKHGRYSKHLPTRLAQRYQDAENDIDLTSVRSDVALVDTYVTSCLDAIAKAGKNDKRVTALWSEIREWIELRRRLCAIETQRERDLMLLVPVDKIYAVMRMFLEEVRLRVSADDMAALSKLWMRIAGNQHEGRRLQ